MIQEAASLTLLECLDNIRTSSSSSLINEDFWKAEEPYLTHVMNTLHINREQALLMSLLLEKSEMFLSFPSDFARAFSLSNIKMLNYEPLLTDLVDRGYLFHRKSGTTGQYHLTTEAYLSLKEGKAYEMGPVAGLSCDDFLLLLHRALTKRIADNMFFNDLVKELSTIINNNPEQKLSQEIHRLNLTGEDIVLMVYLCMNYYLSHTTSTATGKTFRVLFGKKFFHLRAALRNGTNPLVKAEVLTHASCNSRREEDVCTMGEKFLKSVVTPNENEDTPSDLVDNDEEDDDVDIPGFFEEDKPSKVLEFVAHDSIPHRELFYAPEVEKQMNMLTHLLEGDNLANAQQRMRNMGMNEGVCALLYGLPGTGKTAGVHELARRTGRDIYMVDISSIRGKFVGESEKNAKRIWTEYEEKCKSAEKMPILLLNEADAVITKRTPGNGTSSDKAEHAMANICLQGMENFKGICLATANMPESMDPAFERRWLVKVKFDKATPAQCQKVWKSMMPVLTEEQVQELTRDYDFSPGEISNIVRKEQINNVLLGEDRDIYSSVRENCVTERLNNTRRRVPIGFCKECV